MQFYISEDHGGLLDRLTRRVVERRRPVPPFPRIVQIQTLGGCNARCHFCPNTATIGKIKIGMMDEDLFRKIIDEVVQHPVKRISPFLMNEPLSDKRLPDLIRYAADRKPPGCEIKINTNGSYLDDEMGERLIESGLDRIHVSFHGIRKETYEESMGNLCFEEVLGRVNGFIEQLRKAKKGPRLKITMVHTTTIDPDLDDIRAYWTSRGIAVNIHALENRSHESVNEKHINVLPMRALDDCDRLMEQAYILWNGECVLCCVDWERTTIFGSVADEPLSEVWNGQAYTDYRRNYIAGNVCGTLCEGCTVQTEFDFKFKPRKPWQRALLGDPEPVPLPASPSAKP